MTPELERYYENRFMMFTSQGWKDLLVDIKMMLDATNTLSGVTVDNLGFKQGEVNMMRWLLNLEGLTESAMEELKGENE